MGPAQNVSMCKFFTVTLIISSPLSTHTVSQAS